MADPADRPAAERPEPVLLQFEFEHRPGRGSQPSALLASAADQPARHDRRLHRRGIGMDEQAGRLTRRSPQRQPLAGPQHVGWKPWRQFDQDACGALGFQADLGGAERLHRVGGRDDDQACRLQVERGQARSVRQSGLGGAAPLLYPDQRPPVGGEYAQESERETRRRSLVSGPRRMYRMQPSAPCRAAESGEDGIFLSALHHGRGTRTISAGT